MVKFPQNESKENVSKLTLEFYFVIKGVSLNMLVKQQTN